MEVEKSLEEQKKELHLLIDSSTNNLVRSISNIFDAMKFDNNNNVQSGGNIEINENMDSIANEINTLLNITNKMKFKELKCNEDEPKKNNNKINSLIIDTLKKLTEIHENIQRDLLEMKKSTFANMIGYIYNNNKPNNI